MRFWWPNVITNLNCQTRDLPHPKTIIYNRPFCACAFAFPLTYPPDQPIQSIDRSIAPEGNLDFENLSHSLFDVWCQHGRATDNHALNREQLELVCEQVGLHGRIASKVADEVFEKLGLANAAGADDANDDDGGDAERVDRDARVSFADFIALIQSDTEASFAASSDGGASANASSVQLLADATCTIARILSSPDLVGRAGPLDDDDDYIHGDGGGGSSGVDSGLNTSKESNGDSPLLASGLCVQCVCSDAVSSFMLGGVLPLLCCSVFVFRVPLGFFALLVVASNNLLSVYNFATRYFYSWRCTFLC